jgi:GT2 family glycosyltransferase
MSEAPVVTIVVVPRERYGAALATIESIHAHTRSPFALVCVDGGSSGSVRRRLAREARERGFKLIRSPRYLAPNEAKNAGLRAVRTRYTVVIENDVVVAPGWLDPLLRCAEETAADVVVPLVCERLPLHEVVHAAGGECSIADAEGGGNGAPRRRLRDRIRFQGRRVADLRAAGELARQPTELAEFHCLLARTETLRRIGGFDEGMLGTREHIDFSLAVRAAGGSMYLEPASVVTFLCPPPLDWRDVPYYALRWSDDWQLASLRHLARKWGIVDDGAYLAERRRLFGFRFRLAVADPLSWRVPLADRSARLRRIVSSSLVRLGRMVGAFLARRYETARSTGLWTALGSLS